MTTETTSSENIYYEVGAVAKISGISPHTIRTWERRGFIEAARRSPTGRRQYSKQQLDQFNLLAKLTKAGDSISAIAKLSVPELRVRLSGYSDPALTVDTFNPLKTLNVFTFESRIHDRLSQLSSRINSGLYDLNQLEEIDESDRPDVVVMEAPPFIAGLTRLVDKVSGRFPGMPIVLFYDFLSREHLRRLGSEGFFLIRLPIQNEQLEQYLFKAAGEKRIPMEVEIEDPENKKDAERLFSESQLITLANATPKLKCECPNHLSALVTSLIAFEDYCQTCAVETPADEQIHKHLGYEVSMARRRVEESLLYLCEAEGLPIPARDSSE